MFQLGQAERWSVQFRFVFHQIVHWEEKNGGGLGEKRTESGDVPMCDDFERKMIKRKEKVIKLGD